MIFLINFPKQRRRSFVGSSFFSSSLPLTLCAFPKGLLRNKRTFSGGHGCRNFTPMNSCPHANTSTYSRMVGWSFHGKWIAGWYKEFFYILFCSAVFLILFVIHFLFYIFLSSYHPILLSLYLPIFMCSYLQIFPLSYHHIIL